ncbi:hypothetical protein VNO77_26984 [Canavalia gladiata]|uniref:Uncharacterized protein n=1 Tax=Canavalia gladiata TaxID=3824 RepID=A0AAN9Q628_CANGL
MIILTGYGARRTTWNRELGGERPSLMALAVRLHTFAVTVAGLVVRDHAMGHAQFSPLKTTSSLWSKESFQTEGCADLDPEELLIGKATREPRRQGQKQP